MAFINPNDDPSIPKKGQVDLGLAGTMPLTGLPLVAQPAASGPGNNLTQLATPDLQTTGKPGVLAGQSTTPPLANIGAPLPAPTPPPATPVPAPPSAPVAAPPATPSPTTTSAATSEPLPQQWMNPHELLKATQPFSEAIRKRADEIAAGAGSLGLLANASDRLQLRHLATQIAEMEISPKVLGQISNSQYQQQRALTGEENTRIKGIKVNSDVEKNAAAIELMKTRQALMPFQVGSQAETANARVALANSKVIFNAAATGAITQDTANKAVTAQEHLMDLATKGGAGPLTSAFQVLPQDVQDLLQPIVGNATSPAAAARRGAFKTAAGEVANPAGAVPPTAAQPAPVAGNNVTVADLQKVAANARAPKAAPGMPHVTAAPATQPLAQAAGMPDTPVPEPTPQMGTGVRTFSFPGASAAAAAPQPTTAAQSGPQPIGEGLSSPPDETAAIKRISAERPELDPPTIRNFFHRAMKVLSNPKLRGSKAWDRAREIVYGAGQ